MLSILDLPANCRASSTTSPRILIASLFGVQADNGNIAALVSGGALRFGEPGWLWLLAAPLALLLLWLWQLWRRAADIRRLARHRRLPAPQRLPRFGDLLAWLCLLLALACTIVSLARPQAIVSRTRTSGVDIVILQDGSASMRVRDVPGDRWRRSMIFLRALGESLRWERDRLALALFAHIATPQIRLTRDPNTFFFFLDHLQDAPPFRLQDDGTWDTNIARGVTWGLRLIEKDQELRGPSPNARAFVLITDGQDWSGETDAALARARALAIPVHVIGVGTTAGGVIPDPAASVSRPPLLSSLDRDSLAVIANAGGGRYFELDREDDERIANAVIDLTRRQGPAAAMEEGVEELYWWALVLAAVCALAGLLMQRDRTALAIQVGATALIALLVLRVLG